jgi:hypothetical protein
MAALVSIIPTRHPGSLVSREAMAVIDCVGLPMSRCRPANLAGAGANPDLNFVLGSKRGIDQCLESALSNPVTLCLIGGSVLAAKFNNAAALASFVATGRVFALGAVMQDLQNDINSSPDPYQTGIGYGRRFCIWIGAAVAFALGGGGQGEADPAGANPLAAAPRGRLASLWLRPRWCAAARSPRECQPMAASVHPGELRRKLWLCRPGTMRLAVAASFCPTGPFTTIYQDLRDFTRAGARANVNNSTG